MARDRTMETPEEAGERAYEAAKEAAFLRVDTVRTLDSLVKHLTRKIAEHARRDDGDVEPALPAVRDLSHVLTVIAAINSDRTHLGGPRTAAPAATGGAWTARPTRPARPRAAPPGWYLPLRRRWTQAGLRFERRRRPAWWDGRHWWTAPPHAGGQRLT